MNQIHGRKLSLTVDYEIFGNGTGDVRQHVTEPTERMCRIAEKFGMSVTIFFELEEYLQFVRHRDKLKHRLGYDPAEEMQRQAADLVRRGHDVQLHLHPQWYEAGLAEGEWQLRHDRLTVDALFDSQEETTRYIGARKEALEALSGQPVTCYRAGGFAAQPGARLLQALAHTGFVIESSVVKGLHRQRPHPLDYRSAPKCRRAWRISSDVSVEDAGGALWEIPVHSSMGRRYHQLTWNRLRAKFSRHVPKARQNEMMDQLGIRKSVPGMVSFLFQPVPIKLDFHNLTPGGLMRMIRRAPAPPPGDPDVLVLIGHTKEHADDAAFEEFLRRVSLDPKLQVVSMGSLAKEFRPGEDSRPLNPHCPCPGHGVHPCLSLKSRSGISRFLQWLEKAGSRSYDPYDIWGTRYSLWARRVYYRRSLAGLPFIAPLLLIEILCPSLRKLFAKKDRFATADAQLLLGFLNLYRVNGQQDHLEKARRLGEELLGYSIPGYSGHCWGYPFDWQNQRGMWARNTPFITCTPYCYEAFTGLYDLTGEDRCQEIAESIATFVHDDLRDTETGPDAAASSYSPKDNSKVINATAYRAWVLYDAAHRFGRDEWLDKAERNLNFILQSQRPDGSWFYATDGHGNYIDHFHTCFVLKKLWKINQLLRRETIHEAIRRGYDFYRRELFFADGLPKMYALKPRTGIVRHEMYDFAEAITLGTLLKDDIPEAFSHARQLAAVLCSRYQLPDGQFVTRVYAGGWRHTFPFIRWPQSQLFHALTNLLRAMANSSANHAVPVPVSEEFARAGS